MNNKLIISGIFLLGLMISFSSCTKDLNITPIDPNVITSGNITNSPADVEAALAKVYASFLINGQGNSDANGTGADITTDNDDFNTYQRAMWNLQELTTDEAICAWGDAGISDLNAQTWQKSNPFLTALYDRCVLSVSYANSVINLTKGNTAYAKYNAEARFLRALSYSYAMDLFGNPPFITENSTIGAVYPTQIDKDVKKARPILFNYIVKELKAIAPLLGKPGFSYPRADQACAWMLLAKLYLNEQVYTYNTSLTTNWDSCAMYCDSVINCGAYQLATNYRMNFGSNNGYDVPGAIASNPEMIFALANNGLYTQGSVGSTFMIQSCSNGTYINAATHLGLPGNANWGGNRGKVQFLNELVDTLTTYGGNIQFGTHADSIFSANPDQRIYLHLLADYQIYSPTAVYPNGVGEYKFTNNQVNTTYSKGGVNDTTQAPWYNPTYSSTAYPIFRLADAYLMRAECENNTSNIADAVTDINFVRARAKATAITAAALSDPLFIMYERGREFYYEGQRRTDLVRFGQFVQGNYNWAWKGNSFSGMALGISDFNIFPLPSSELTANPNIVQNPGY